MTKIYLLLFTGLITMDQASKSYALHHFSKVQKSLFFFNIQSIENHGLFLGILSHHNPFYIVSFHALLAISLVPVLASICYYLPWQAKVMKCALLSLMASILSNSIDKIKYGAVIDFINIKGTSLFFNLSDIALLISVILLTRKILFNRSQVFLSKTRRRRLFINPRYQIKLILISSFFLTTFFIAFVVFFYIFYSSICAELPPGYLLRFRSNFYEALIILAILYINFMLLVFVIYMKYGHTIAGPIYALTRYIENIKSQGSELKLREHDQFQPEILYIAQRVKEIIDRM